MAALNNKEIKEMASTSMKAGVKHQQSREKA